MEGAVPLQTMQLSDVTRERDFLLKQVDTLSVKLVNLDGQLNRERTKSSMLQVSWQCHNSIVMNSNNNFDFS